MSLNSVRSNLSSLKSCQAEIGAYMEVISEVARGMIKPQDEADVSDLKKLEEMMLKSARLDHEINIFVESVDELTEQIRPDTGDMVGLRAAVKDRYTELVSGVTVEDLQKNRKLVAFRDIIRPAGQTSREEAEELDVDIAVTQSQTNFICPLTQAEMVNPVKNTKCQHYYDRDAVLELIKARRKNKKPFHCPRVGCENRNIKESDLELDPLMKKMIQAQKK